MSKSGETSQHRGVYRSSCCGCEIVIPQGATFPECPFHKELIADWRPVEIVITGIRITRGESTSESKKRDPAA